MPQMADRVREGVGESRVRELSGVEFRAVDGQNRTYELSFASEEPVNRWWGIEILSHEPDGPQLGRLNDGGCLLYGHQTDLPSVLGPVNKAWLDPQTRKCRAIVTFDTDADADRALQKVQSGTLRGVSVSYSLDLIEEVPAGHSSSNGRWTGPCDVITRWTPYEISIVPVPADNTVGVGRSMDLTAEAEADADNELRQGAAEAERSAGAREVDVPVTDIETGGSENVEQRQPDVGRGGGVATQPVASDQIASAARDAPRPRPSG